ncbi:HAMP domain-containing histidine kinase [Paenibacillus sp. IB182496]|uniref:histidine kinase n=2 Tax=Paenibacillus sabuli TaxID=2772509 RepID=A0A927BTN6_9BACL|nr:HAMP domain-containing histidine kinase [Paenibacillus sabuli]
MFKRLRNRFLLLNLVTIAVIMLVAFTSIYMITYRNVQRDIDMELRRIGEFHQRLQGGTDNLRPGQAITPASGAIEGTPPATAPGNAGGPGLRNDAPFQPDRAIGFTLRTDSAWNLLDINSPLEMEEALYDEALTRVAERGRVSGQFSLDGSDWAYRVTQYGEQQTIVFLDVSARQTILTNLTYTFGLVALAMLVVLYFASRYFANRAIAPVREAFAKQKQFIADASHELKTPLTIINTNADVLLAGSDDARGGQAKWLGYIKAETERMTRLTNDLLYLTELDESRVRMLHAIFNLSDAVENRMLTMEAVLYEHRIDLQADIEPGLQAHGNAEQIKQVLTILLDNAVKYTPARGAVTLQLRRLQQEAVLTVSNTGQGIAPEHLPRLFDRFYRTDTSRARGQGGYGLGLAIARSIVEQHRGRIYASSVPGVSTTFHLHLPLA